MYPLSTACATPMQYLSDYLVDLAARDPAYSRAKLVGLRAPLGAGKTEAMVHEVDLARRQSESRRSGPVANVLTHRRSLAHSLARRYDLACYLDCATTQALADAQQCTDGIVISVQTMGRGRILMYPGEILLIDEILAVLRTVAMESTIPGSRRLHTLRSIRTQVQAHRRVIVADAHLTPERWRWVCDALGVAPEDAYYVDYPPEIRRGTVYLVDRQAQFLQRIRDGARKGHVEGWTPATAMWVWTATRSMTRAITAELRKLGLDPLEITPETSATGRVQAWVEDPTSSREPVVVASPSVTAGLSVSVLPDGQPQYATVYAHFANPALDRTDLLQAIGRVRGSNTRYPAVYLYVPSVTHGGPEPTEKVLADTAEKIKERARATAKRTLVRARPGARQAADRYEAELADPDMQVLIRMQAVAVANHLASSRDLRACIAADLKADGHCVLEAEEIETEEGIFRDFRASAAERRTERIDLLMPLEHPDRETLSGVPEQTAMDMHAAAHARDRARLAKGPTPEIHRSQFAWGAGETGCSMPSLHFADAVWLGPATARAHDRREIQAHRGKVSSDGNDGDGECRVEDAYRTPGELSHHIGRSGILRLALGAAGLDVDAIVEGRAVWTANQLSRDRVQLWTKKNRRLLKFLGVAPPKPGHETSWVARLGSMAGMALTPAGRLPPSDGRSGARVYRAVIREWVRQAVGLAELDDAPESGAGADPDLTVEPAALAAPDAPVPEPTTGIDSIEEALARRAPLCVSPAVADALDALDHAGAAGDKGAADRAQAARTVLGLPHGQIRRRVMAAYYSRSTGGRLYSCGPPIQGTPHEMRQHLHAGRGRVVITGDYSTCHLWVATLVDATLHADLGRGGDIAVTWAAEYGAKRGATKMAALAWLNGAGAATLDRILSESGAAPGAGTRMHGDLIGRYCTLAHLRADEQARGGGWRSRLSARWTRVEAAAMDHVLARLHARIGALGVWLHAPLHDGIVISAPMATAAEAGEALALLMREAAAAVSLPKMRVKVHISKTWDGPGWIADPFRSG